MLISIIVPVYKVESYLRQCVDSLINQTYRDLEIILVDDGSPDTCPKICNEYAEADLRVKVIHKENGGVSSARQAGIAASRGSYITIVDGDDWLDVNTIESCVEAMAGDQNVDCVVFSYVREYPQGSFPSHILEQSCILEGQEAEDRVYRRLFGLIGDELRHPERLESMGSCCMKLYRKDLAEKGRFFYTCEVGSSEDTLFNMYALHGCKKVVYLDEPFYHYRKVGNSITSSYRPRLMKQWGRLFDYMEEVLEEKSLGLQYRQALDARIALSVFGIGANELGAQDSFFSKALRIKKYISSERYTTAVSGISLSQMPTPWKAMLFFAKHRMSVLLCTELNLIYSVRKIL